jgi:hypothetical protein
VCCGPGVCRTLPAPTNPLESHPCTLCTCKGRRITSLRKSPQGEGCPGRFLSHSAQRFRILRDCIFLCGTTQVLVYLISLYGIEPETTSTNGFPFFTPTVPKPLAVDRKQRKSPLSLGLRYKIFSTAS